MRRCKYVEYYDGFHHELEEIEKNRYKLKSIEGNIIFCESNSRGLVIKLRNHQNPKITDGKVIIWDLDGKKPLPAICGQGLRCFYEEIYLKGNEEKINLDAWELLNKPDSSFVVRRATKHNRYKFIDFD